LRIREFFGKPFNLAWSALIKPLRELQVTEQENALLRVLCFFTPIPQLSEAGMLLVNGSHQKYLNALNELVLLSRSPPPLPSSSPLPQMQDEQPCNNGGSSRAVMPMSQLLSGVGQVQVLGPLADDQQQMNPMQRVIGRMSRLLVLLSIVEQVSQLDDDAITMMSVFNLSGMRGTLPYEIHLGGQHS